MKSMRFLLGVMLLVSITNTALAASPPDISYVEKEQQQKEKISTNITLHPEAAIPLFITPSYSDVVLMEEPAPAIFYVITPQHQPVLDLPLIARNANNYDILFQRLRPDDDKSRYTLKKRYLARIQYNQRNRYRPGQDDLLLSTRRLT